LSHQSYKTAGKTGPNMTAQSENSTRGWYTFAGQVKWVLHRKAGVEKGGSIPSTNALQRIAKATGHNRAITFTRNA